MGTDNQWKSEYRGPVSTKDPRNIGYRGPVGTEGQRNSETRGTVGTED